jgi:hypothetical protein
VINLKLYKLLYDPNIYLLAKGQISKLDKKTALVLTRRDLNLFASSHNQERVPGASNEGFNILACLLGYNFSTMLANSDQDTFNQIIIRIISQIKAGNYQFSNISRAQGVFLNSLSSNTLSEEASSGVRSFHNTSGIKFIPGQNGLNLMNDLLVVKLIVMILEAINQPI